VPTSESLILEAGTYIVAAPKDINKQLSPPMGINLMAEQKYLRNKNNGVIFVYDEALATRSDMEPYEGNVEKENERIESDATANTGTLEVAGDEKVAQAEATQPFAEDSGNDGQDETETQNDGGNESNGEVGSKSRSEGEDESAEGPSEEERLDKITRIANAIDKLDPDDYNMSGKPKLKPIENIIQDSVSATERDRAMELRNA